LLTIAGCDSILTTNLSVNSSINGSQTMSICLGDSVVVGTNTYKSTGTYADTLVAIGGCDSILTTQLTVDSVLTNSQTLVLCNGDSVVVGLNTYKTSGIYMDTLVAGGGCDSVVTTHLTIGAVIASSQTFAICTGDSVVVGSVSHKTTGIFTDVLSASNGCDSTVTTNLTVSTTLSSSQTIGICTGDSLVIGTNSYKVSGTYSDTLVAAGGCDSVLTTNLTVNTFVTGNQSFTICDGDRIIVGTSAYSTSGAYTDTLTAGGGCDSILTTNLTVRPAITSSQSVSICNGESLVVGSNTYIHAGTYTDVFTAANGCDSTLTTILTVNNLSSKIQGIKICAGDSVVINSHVYKTPGRYKDTLVGSNGCDSILTTDISFGSLLRTVARPDTVLISDETRPGTTYQWIDCINGDTILPGDTNRTIVPRRNGGYAVVMTSGSCVDTSGCYNVQWIIPGFNEHENGLKYRMYPNPTRDMVNIEFDAMVGDAIIRVYDIRGRLVKSLENNQSQEVQFSTINMEQGVYIVEIVTENGLSQSRLIKTSR